MGAFLEFDVVAVFVRQTIFNAEIAIAAVGAIHGNLGLLRLAAAGGGDDFVHGSRQDGAGRFWNSGSIEVEMRDAGGPGHARLGHFPVEAGMLRGDGFFLGLAVFMRHAFMAPSGGKGCSRIRDSSGEMGRFAECSKTCRRAPGFRGCQCSVFSPQQDKERREASKSL